MRARAAIAFRCAVASSSDWPPERNAIPGTAAGTKPVEAVERRSATSSTPARSARVAGQHHVRLQEHALAGRRAGRAARRRRPGAPGWSPSSLGERVGAVHHELGLDDRDEAGLLADRRIARQGVGVRPHRIVAGKAGADRERRAPFAKRAPRPRYSSSRARRPSRPSVTVSPGAGERLVPLSALIPGRIPAPAGGPETAFRRARWRIVSSKRMTPLITSSSPAS